MMQTTKFQRNQGQGALRLYKAIGAFPDFLEKYQTKQVNFKDAKVFTPEASRIYTEALVPLKVSVQRI